MSFKFEATDYGTIEWNVGTGDGGILTWGPLGATAGQAFQVQRILADIDQKYPETISSAFGTEANAIRALRQNGPSRRHLRSFLTQRATLIANVYGTRDFTLSEKVNKQEIPTIL